VQVKRHSKKKWPLQQLVSLDKRASAHLAIPDQARVLRALALIAAHSGDSPLWLIAATIALVWGNAVWWGFGGRVIIGTLASGAATTLLKWLFRRGRPPGPSIGFYTQFDHHAFPSGHAGRCACLIVLLAPLLPPWGILLMTLWGGLVGLGRIALQVHFITDIVGGWLVGLSVGCALRLVI
jgi:undecaprenyl-diphosphatase